MVIHKQQAGPVPQPPVLGPVVLRTEHPARGRALLAPADCARARRLAQGHQVMEGVVLSVESYYEAAGMRTLTTVLQYP